MNRCRPIRTVAPLAVAVLALSPLVTTVAARADSLYMSAGHTVYQFDGATGALLGSGQVDSTNVQAEGLAVGPDGKLYAAVAFGGNRVVSFDADLTGRSTFVAEGQGGLFTPMGLDFGGDGNLYVASTNGGAVNRYQGPGGTTPGANDPSAGHSGAVFAPAGNSLGMAFAADGGLYVSRETNGGEIDYIDSTGIVTPVATGLGSNGVGDIAIRGSELFVRDANAILNFNINADHTLTLDPTFHLLFTQGTGMDSHVGMTFGSGGFLYADTRFINTTPGLDSVHNTDWVVRIDPTTGAVSRFVTGGINSFGATDPSFITAAAPAAAVPTPAAAAGGLALLGGLAVARGRRCRTPVA